VGRAVRGPETAVDAIQDALGNLTAVFAGVDIAGVHYAGDGTVTRVRVLVPSEPEFCPRGVLFRCTGRPYLLVWERVCNVLAAEVGEPEGVRATIFDLMSALESGELGVCRISAEPGESARVWAHTLLVALGKQRCSASLCAVAERGFASRCYPDLASFEEAEFKALTAVG